MIELRISGAVADLGYVLARAHWNAGLMTEAVACICDWARGAGIERISAICDVENVGSARVLKKSGFRLDQARAKAIHPNASDEPRTCLSFSLALTASDHPEPGSEALQEGD